MMLRGAGFEVVDIGVDVPPGKFVEEAGKDGVQIVQCLTSYYDNAKHANDY